MVSVQIEYVVKQNTCVFWLSGFLEVTLVLIAEQGIASSAYQNLFTQQFWGCQPLVAMVTASNNLLHH